MRPASRDRFRALALALAVVAVSGCTERRTAERADSDLSHDLALTNRIAAHPALQDTAIAPAPQPRQPPAPAPRRERTPPAPQAANPAPPPTAVAAAPDTQAAPDSGGAAAAAPAPAPMIVGAGTGIALRSGMRVCTNSNKIGDKLVATVTTPATGSGGAVIPSGSRVVLEVAQVAPGDTVIGFRPMAIYIGGSTYPVSGSVTASTAMQRAGVPSTGATDKEKVAGGAIAGAILGQILGHDTKSTVIGAAAGAAAGAAVAHAQKQYQACLPEGATLTLTLDAPVTLH